MDASKKTDRRSNTLIWGVLFLVGAVMLVWSLSTSRTGQVWVEPTDHAFVENTDGSWSAVESPGEDAADISWTTYSVVSINDLTDAKIENGDVTFSWSRTIGLWIAAIFTLFILSFLVGDNPAYKFAEALVVGTSAGYLMVIGIWDMLIPNLVGKLVPTVIQGWNSPGLKDTAENWDVTQWIYLIPAILIVMLLWQLIPKGGWISRWPIAFFIGITAGFRMIGFVEADLVAQVNAGIVPLWVADGDGFNFWLTFNNVVLTIATLSAMIYFFFSVEHKGLVGRVARVGIWFMMITFGASFGYTVMGRIALLSERMEFLFGDWLHFIPTN